MPIAKPKNDRRYTPICKHCREKMIPTLSVPLQSAPGIEDVYYECPNCKAEVKLTAIPE